MAKNVREGTKMRKWVKHGRKMKEMGVERTKIRGVIEGRR